MTTYPESHKYGATLTQSMAFNTVKTAIRQGGNRVSQAKRAFSVNAPTFLPQYGREVHIATEDGQRALCSDTHRTLGSGLLPEFPVPVREAGYEWDASSYRLCPDCESRRQATTDSGFAPGQPYFEICPASGPDAFSSKRNPTCANQGTAEHNTREYSRDGRSYAVERIDAEGKRSKVSEFCNGRKIRQASA